MREGERERGREGEGRECIKKSMMDHVYTLINVEPDKIFTAKL